MNVHQRGSIQYLYRYALEVQPPFEIGWFPNHHFLSKGLSSSQRGATIFKWWLTCRVYTVLVCIRYHMITYHYYYGSCWKSGLSRKRWDRMDLFSCSQLYMAKCHLQCAIVMRSWLVKESQLPPSRA